MPIKNTPDDTSKAKQLADLEDKMRANFRLIQLVNAMSNLQTGLIMGSMSPPVTGNEFMINDHASQNVTTVAQSSNVTNTISTINNKDNICEPACMARRNDGKQCTKPKHTRLNPNTDYCNVHQKRQPYGRVDTLAINTTHNNVKSKGKPGRKKKDTEKKDNTKSVENSVPKKRGRKRKHPMDNRFRNPNYIVMWPEIINGDKCLVDRFGRVFTYSPDKLVYLGTKTVDNQLSTK